MKHSLFSCKAYVRILMICMPLTFFIGCQRQIHVTNNAFADVYSIPRGFTKRHSFFILPVKLCKTCENKLFAKEIAHKAATILEDKNYLIDDEENADYCVQINCAIEEETVTVDIATYIPGETKRTKGCIEGRKDIVHYNETEESDGKFVYVPEERTLFRKTLIVEVYDARHYRKTKEKEPAWQGSAMICDGDSDLRESIDYLLITAFNHFGKNTQRTVATTIGSKDTEVERLRSHYFFS